MKQLFITTILFISLSIQAQNNSLLNRAFWKKNPDLATVEAEIKKGNNPTELDANAFDPTVLAINENASNDVVKYLLSIKGNDVNKSTHDKRTYVFWAAYRGNLELMQYLVSKGAKMNLLDDKGYSVLNFAASSGQTNTLVYDFCIKNGINPAKDVDYAGANALLLVAPHDKDFNLIGYFLSKGLDINSTDSNGNTAFNYAAKTGNIATMKSLLERKVKFTDNAMIMASQGVRGVTNPLSVYQFLEEMKINPNAISKNGENALHSIARKEKQGEIIKYFLSKGVSIDQADNDGNTPFMNAAASNNDIETISMLLSNIKDINQINKKGVSAVAFALRSNSSEVVKLLIEKGANLTLIDKNQENLVAYLIQSYNPQKIADFETKLALLKQKGFDIDSPQKNGNTLFHLAIAKNDLSLLKLIYNFKIDVNQTNNEKMTVLHKAALTAKDDTILKYLISIEAKKDAKTDLGETAYDLASENEHLSKNKVSIDFLK